MHVKEKDKGTKTHTDGRQLDRN